MKRWLAAVLIALIAALLLLGGRFLIPNEITPLSGDPKILKEEEGKIRESGAFSHALWDAVLKAHTKGGFVDYAALAKDRPRFDTYLALLARYSPASHPELFKSRADSLAYWINAYNALCIQNVLRRYDQDFKSVQPVTKAFFYSDRFVLGGVYVSLYSLEKTTILEEFKDPRLHFALNCASFSCPRLPETAFEGSRLEAQLDKETRLFLAEERNVAIDAKSGTLTLSKLFDWYRSHFCDWPDCPEVRESEGSAAKLVAFINRYRAAEQRIPAREGGWAIAHRPYNWRLNDRGEESGEPAIIGG